MASPSYYGDTTATDQTPSAQRQKQAVQSALIQQQNIVDPSIDPDPSVGDPGFTAPGYAAPAQATSPSTFTPTPGSQQSFSGPSGIPDPNNPGYDTTGYLLGSTYNSSTGQLTIPNSATGQTATSYVDSSTGSMLPNPSPSANSMGVSFTPSQTGADTTQPATTSTGDVSPAPTGSGGPLPQSTGDWINMINAFVGDMPATQLPTNLLSPSATNAQNAQNSLLQSVLANPNVYSDQDVAAMQEEQKEQALALEQSSNQQLQDQLAGMGRAGSGYQLGQEQRNADTANSQILQSNRDVALQAAQANNTAQLNALQQAQSILGSQSNTALQQALGQAALNQQSYAQAIQAALGASGLSLNQFSAANQNQQAWNSLMALIGINNTNAVNANNTTLAS